MKKLMLFLLVALPLFAANAAAAATVSAKEPDKILSIAQGFGSAALDKDSTGDPKITGRIDGTKYMILFFGCVENKNCTSIQFAAGWSLSEEDRLSLPYINEWNKGKRFGKAYIDSEGDPMIEMDLPLREVPAAYLEDCFEWWQVALGEFKAHIQNK